MLKNILLGFIIALIAGCSTPKPDTPPSWYTTLPKDDTNFYGVGDGKSEDEAKEKALISLRNNLKQELNTAFKDKNHKLNKVNEDIFSQILEMNTYLSNTLSTQDIKIEKSANFKNTQLVLLSLPKTSILHQINDVLEMQLHEAQREYKSFSEIKIENDNPIIAVKKYKIIHQAMKEFPKTASLVQLKKSSLSAYSANKKFDFLYKFAKDYSKLKSDITFYVLSDVNSLTYVPPIIEAIELEGIVNSRTAHGKYSLKLLVTSKTDNVQDYSFNKSKNLVKLKTYDENKNEIAFRQHTFIGMSRKDYDDAKKHSAEYLKAKIKKLGIFEFIGI